MEVTDTQTFSLKTKAIPLMMAICIGIFFSTSSAGATDLKFTSIVKHDIQKLLTEEEQAWLLKHKTIRIAGPKSFPPFHYYEEDGTLKGMASDYIHLILEHLNILPDIQSNMEWPKVLKEAEKRNIDLISCTAKTMERESYLWFTQSYLSFPLVIITKTNSPFIGGVHDLNDKTVAFIKGAAAYDWIGRDNVTLIPYFVKTPLEGLKAVSLGKAGAHIDNLATASYLIQKQGLANLKIAAPAFNKNYNLYIGVRKDWPELVSIINKLLTNITPRQQSQIRNKWLSVKYDYGIPRADVIKWILGITCIAMTIFAVILTWNRRLRKEIIERRKAEDALILEKTFVDAIFNSIPGILYLYDAKGNLVRWNKKHEIMTGYSSGELSKMQLTDWYKGDEKSLKSVTEGLKRTIERGFGEAEGNLQKKDGSIIPTYLTASPLTINGKQYFTGIGIDITDRKRAEEEKQIAQKMAYEHEKQALVGKIAGKMAHDFNNILGIIMGNTELSLLDCEEPATKKTLELIYEQTIRGKNLTKNLVAFAKDQEPKQEFFRINEKIELVLNLMKKDLDGIELLKEESSGVPELLADPGMIEHAFVNMIQNSIHALSLVEYPRIIVRTYSCDTHICLEIEDNGCGISTENLENIYEPAFTLKGSKDVTGSYKVGIQGTGYGMSNVKKYIEQHKGHISIESKLGSGTKFTISLPVIKKELTSEEKKEIRAGKAYFEKYILLVEDETAISGVQYRILTQAPCNHKVDIANNGQVAMDLFGRNKYDLVSLDYILPGNINGMDIYHHIRLSDKTIPVLFTSGNIEFLESIKELKQKDTQIDHLSKPCRNKDYVNGINGLFEGALAAKG